jgi:pimeloyl-ACP methyl ester carboxylesterase
MHPNIAGMMPPRPRTVVATSSRPLLRPSLALFGSEPVRALWEAIDHLKWRRRSPALNSDGHKVILFPGLATNGRAMRPLSRHLRGQGYRVFDWGQGWNTGPGTDLDAWLDGLADAVFERAAVKPGERISLVGWSLGGFYAREIARLWPQRVRRVISIGTPFNGRPEDSNVGWLFRLLNGRHAPTDLSTLRRLATPPPVPTTAIFSRSDGVVAWQSCRHSGHFQHVHDVEIVGSHLGMGFNREVFDVVTRDLARDIPLRREPRGADRAT